jgi:hypothetical protein
MAQTVNNLDKILNTDPLQLAEQVTGKSYKDDEATSALGLFAMLANNLIKEEALKAADDTYYNIPTADFLRIIEADGFVVLRSVPIVGDEGRLDTQYVLWNPDEGLLMHCDTYYGQKTINSCTVYFNWRQRVRGGGFPDSCSGHYTGDFDNKEALLTWVGHMDGREGLIHKLTKMRADGAFQRQWVERPFLWLLSYVDDRALPKDDRVPGYEACNAKMIATLPPDVQACITP